MNSLLVSIILVLVVHSVKASKVVIQNPVCCKKFTKDEWESADVKYNIAIGGPANKDLYHSERYKIIGGLVVLVPSTTRSMKL